jgi:phosphatidylinositol glycan class A protein
MGLKTVFTDHSLFGFADAGSILTNKLLKFTLSDVSHVICVSHTCKENTVLRAALNPQKVSVIPNAVVSEDFLPDPTRAAKNITIIVISRLYSNKGADLLTAIIPRICALHPTVQFLIAGSGPKEIDLQQMREKYRLQERVELIGSIRHEEVRDVMTSGHIYLHASLTEAFGTVIVEAASCGLLVVTTKVGGIPEVLPSHMTVFASPSADSLVKNTLEAISMVENKKVDCSTFHDQIKGMYCWEDVAKRTEHVYDSIDPESLNPPLLNRLQKYYRCGPWAGKLFVLCVIVDLLLYQFLEWYFPRSSIDAARKWPAKHPRDNEPPVEIDSQL